MKKDEGLVRGISLPGAISLNMINMIGVGPFVTLPLIVLAMHGPQAILGWVLGAVLAACDGLVWAELGAAMPKAGGSYEYLRTIYGPRTTGRYLSFLYIWQLSFSAPLSIASGCVGLAQYAGYLWPALRKSLFFLSIADPGSVCAHAAAGDPAWTGHFGSDALLRDRRDVAVSQYTERDPVFRLAVDGGHGHDAGGDPHRAAALSR